MSFFGSGDDYCGIYRLLSDPKWRLFIEKSDKEHKEKNRKKTMEEIKKEREDFEKLFSDYKDYL